ncbi:MAG: hypothetical protein AAF721_06045 [Myxococcota bacterium]
MAACADDTGPPSVGTETSATSGAGSSGSVGASNDADTHADTGTDADPDTDTDTAGTTGATVDDTGSDSGDETGDPAQATRPDLDGDGVIDLVIGARGYTDLDGAVWIDDGADQIDDGPLGAEVRLEGTLNFGMATPPATWMATRSTTSSSAASTGCTSTGAARS